MNERQLLFGGALLSAIGLYVYTRTQKGASAAADVVAATVDTSGSVASGAGELLSEIQLSVSKTVATFGSALGLIDAGFRNNNPGNMMYAAGITWQGQIGHDSKGRLIFDTMQNGIRAMVKELRNYSLLHGLDNVQGLITRWSATDQTAYVANVSAHLQVDPYDYIDVNDPATMAGLVDGIIKQENGAVLAASLPGDIVSTGITAGLNA